MSIKNKNINSGLLYQTHKEIRPADGFGFAAGASAQRAGPDAGSSPGLSGRKVKVKRVAWAGNVYWGWILAPQESSPPTPIWA
jgi:hypothetical protein